MKLILLFLFFASLFLIWKLSTPELRRCFKTGVKAAAIPLIAALAIVLVAAFTATNGVFIRVF